MADIPPSATRVPLVQDQDRRDEILCKGANFRSCSIFCLILTYGGTRQAALSQFWFGSSQAATGLQNQAFRCRLPDRRFG